MPKFRYTKCPICGKEFKVPSGRREVIYCSKECSDASKRQFMDTIDKDIDAGSGLAQAIVLQAIRDNFGCLLKIKLHENSEEDIELFNESSAYLRSAEFDRLRPLLPEFERHTDGLNILKNIDSKTEELALKTAAL